ncbi:MAG: hypothetical protein LBB73_05335 [Dysgonamonadaceae bacterium]|nr:hypothetical protein [Dysgonamonadaceae bacterium]
MFERNLAVRSFSSLSFLDRFGVTGDFINLELRMILRSPRLKQQVVPNGYCSYRLVFLYVVRFE